MTALADVHVPAEVDVLPQVDVLAEVDVPAEEDGAETLNFDGSLEDIFE